MSSSHPIRDLERFAAALSPRRRQLIELVGRFRLISADQLRRLVASDLPGTNLEADRRLLRRDLIELSAVGCLFRLERRIGGVRGGSAGAVYALGAAGSRLVRYWQGEGLARPRSRYEPSTGFVDHALAVSETLVSIIEAGRLGALDVRYCVERDAWRSWLGVHGEQLQLKPDAELRLTSADYEDHWWLEVDRGTERRTALGRKLAATSAYYRSGAEQARAGVFPRTLWLVPNESRVAVLRDIVDGLAPEERRLFTVAEARQATQLLVEGADS